MTYIGTAGEPIEALRVVIVDIAGNPITDVARPTDGGNADVKASFSWREVY